MEPVRRRLAELAPGVELVENLRFDPGEEANDENFAKRLVDGVDGYVNDAPGASHRAHASIVGPPRFVPSAMGRLLQREVEVLLTLRESPKRPFVAVLGGAKVSDKLGVIEVLPDNVDALAVGGAMCFTFFAAQGRSIGNLLLFEPDQVETCAARLLDAGKRIHLPTDIIGLDADGDVATWGPRARRWQGARHRPGLGGRIRRRHHRGPHGVLERTDGNVRGSTLRRRYSAQVAEAVAATKAFTVVGGGDSAAKRSPSWPSTTRSTTCPPGRRSLELLEPAGPARPEALRRGWRWPHDRALSAHLGDLEDELQPLRGDSDDAKARLPGPEGAHRGDRREHPSAVHRPAQSADVDRRRQAALRPRRPTLPLGGQGATHRRGVPSVPGCFSSTLPTSSAATASVASSSGRPTTWWPPRSPPCSAMAWSRSRRRGDTRRARREETTDKVLGQIDSAIAGRTKEQIASMVVAYEPIYMIGTGRTATATDAQTGVRGDPERMDHVIDPATAATVRIQYGGSVNSGNIAELMSEADIDGALVGGRLDPDEFAKILTNAVGHWTPFR